MKVIIAGSRSISDYSLVLSAVKNGPFGKDLTIVVSGRARGVDSLGERYAQDFDKLLATFPADWNTHGMKAGYLRNVQMAEYADALIAVWNGESKGTRHMIEQMFLRKKPVYVVFA
jgi:hypothetical protein